MQRCIVVAVVFFVIMKGFVLRLEARTWYIVWHSSFPYVMCHYPNFSFNPASVFPSLLSSRLKPKVIDDVPQSDIVLLAFLRLCATSIFPHAA
jgi:hypothetical protein